MAFRFKRFPDESGNCWMAVDLGKNIASYNDWIIFENGKMTFGNNNEEKIFITEKWNLDFYKWYDFKLVLSKGEVYDFYLDGNKVASYKKNTPTKYRFIKLEGNPVLGNWYVDDIELKYKK